MERNPIRPLLDTISNEQEVDMSRSPIILRRADSAVLFPNELEGALQL